MKFVIFSCHFLPMAGAESYCTTRFASALAAAGHNVHVVTMDWPKGVSDEVYDFLVDRRMRITRVPLTKAIRPPVMSRIRYLTHEWDSVNFSSAISVLKDVLAREGNPVLLTRSFPWASFIVGWHCRKFASKWIAHLSDPLPAPWEPPSTLTFKLRRLFGRFWVKRILRDADMLTLTCEEAKTFFSREYGKAFDEMVTCVVTHIGEPPLPARINAGLHLGDRPYVVHTGDFYADRGAMEMLDAMSEVNAQGTPCDFVQCGHVDRNIVHDLETCANFRIMADAAPEDAAAAAAGASAVFIPDVNTPLDYVPFLPSKFAYQIFSDKPLILFSKRKSELFHLCERYPDSGLYFADRDQRGSLREAIFKALDDRVCHDRSEIRKLFSRDRVAKSVVSAVEKI